MNCPDGQIAMVVPLLTYGVKKEGNNQWKIVDYGH